MNALLKTAVAWRNADDDQQLILDAMNGSITQCEFQRLLMEHEEITNELVLPAARALRLAIEQATQSTEYLEKAIEMEREIIGHLMVDDPNPQIMEEWREAREYTDSLVYERAIEQAETEMAIQEGYNSE